MKGLTHIYTGDGKGKTTASLGLSIRAAGRGRKVVIMQFLKGDDTGELSIINSIENIQIFRNSKQYGFFFQMKDEDKAAIINEHNEMLDKARQLMDSAEVDLLVLDEIMAAYNLEALDREKADDLVLNKPDGVELVLTGRDAPQHWRDAADYVSVVTKEKHPFDKGVPARKGVEF